MNDLVKLMCDVPLTVRGAAKLLGVSPYTIQRQRKAEKLPPLWTWAVCGIWMEAGQIPHFDGEREIDREAELLSIHKRKSE